MKKLIIPLLLSTASHADIISSLSFTSGLLHLGYHKDTNKPLNRIIGGNALYESHLGGQYYDVESKIYYNDHQGRFNQRTWEAEPIKSYRIYDRLVDYDEVSFKAAPSKIEYSSERVYPTYSKPIEYSSERVYPTYSKPIEYSSERVYPTYSKPIEYTTVKTSSKEVCDASNVCSTSVTTVTEKTKTETIR
jgi:hypothetical protein